MVGILIVGDDAPLVHSCARSLGDAGHRVELAPDVLRAHDRLSGEACEVVVIDVGSPDGGLGLLIEQARSAWPDCAVIALVRRPDIARSKVHQMGLWTPDAMLSVPVSGGELVRTVAGLRSQRPSPATPSAGGALI